MAGRTKSILLRTEVRPAGRRCNCKHNHTHEIVKGEPRLVVKDAGPAARERGYCRECGESMLDAAAERIEGLRAELSQAL
jgi:hypothetical protein